MRVPPQSIEAEASLLGALLLDQDAFDEIASEISPEDFYKESHRHIFRSMQKIVGRQEGVDAVTLVEQLASEQLLDAVGGMAYIAGLTGQVPTAANVSFYSNIVHRKSVLRKLLSISAEITEECYGDIDDLEAFLNSAESKILTLGEERTVSRVQSLKDVVKEAYFHIEALYERDEKITGVPSGFLDLDQITAGWQNSDLIIIAARPAMGKCLSKDALILLEGGRLSTIEAIVQGDRGRILTLDEDGWRFGMVSPSAFVDDGIKPVFEVTTRLGRTIEVTASHPFRKEGGWHPLADLVEGDRVAVPRVLDVFGRASLRECEVKLLAYFTIDDTLAGPSPSLEHLSPQVRADFLDAASSLGGGSMTLGDLAGSLSGAGLDVGPGCIPEVVFCLERPQVALFLNRLLSVGAKRGEGEPGCLRLSSSHERLVRQLQHLLLRFGVVSVVAQAADGVWRLSIGDSLPLFLREIGRPGWGEESLPDVINGEAPTRGEVYWDEIVSIVPMGLKQVYDLTIPGTHNFVANDICVHNTAFCLNMASNAATRFGKVALFCSLEMSAQQLAMRLLASEARVDVSRIRTGQLKEHEWRRLIQATATLSKAPIFIDDTPALNPQTLLSRARRLKVEHGLDMIMVDYLQLMSASGPGVSSREQVISEISRTLKLIAKDLGIPVIALAQLNRGVESRADKRPMLSDLRESGAIEQDADIISFVYRDEYYNEDSEAKGIAEIIIGKHRSGSTGMVQLRFFPEYTRFENLAREDEENP